VSPEESPAGTTVPSDLLMEVMGHGLDEVLDCENVGLELVAAIRTRIQKSELLAKILNNHIEQRRNDARHAEFLQGVIHEALWFHMCERLAPAIPPVDPEIPPGVLWTLPGFSFGKWLGNGSFCTVYKLLPLTGAGGEQTDSDEVIKVVDKSLIKEPEDIKQLGCMIDIMRKLNQLGMKHPNITELRGIYHSPTHIFFRESFGGPQNLFSRLTQRQQQGHKQRPLGVNHVIAIITQFCSAIAHIHTQLQLCHRDIKPENILIDDTTENLYLKLTDFDLATVQRGNTLCRKVCGTMPFIAPEVLSQSRFDGFAADMWSAGIVIFEICSGTKVLEKILASQRADFKLSNTKTVSSRKSTSEFIKTCFSKPGFAVKILDEQCLDEIRSILPVVMPLFHGICTVNVDQRLTAVQLSPFMVQLEELRLGLG